MENVKRSKYDVFYECFWIFMFGCVFGTIWEVFNHFIHHGTLVSRSALIYGPFNPVYGCGALIFMLIVKIKNPIKIYLSGMVLGGLCEYICSFVQEKVFGTVSWNYSNKFLNIGGRTSLFYMLFWGLLALVFVKRIYPHLSNIIKAYTFKYSDIVTFCFLAFMCFNCIISVGACMRQKERADGLKASNGVEAFLDKHYPDERLDKIYQNSVSVDTKKSE